jgi:predicted transcriptional regulator
MPFIAIVTEETMSKKKEKVLKFIAAAAAPVKLREIARACFPGVRPVEKADSQVRNQLRTLRRDQLVKKIARGTYAPLKKANAALAASDLVAPVAQ